MKSFLLRTGILLLLALLSHLCFAHPGIGIVKDSKGFIYYTDLKQVWKVDPFTGKKEIVVRGVHTHELFIDANDDLYGEHLWYNGEGLNTWGHYVWSLRNNGKLDTIIKPSHGLLENYSFVRDKAGNMYTVQRYKGVARIQKISPAGDVTTLVEGKFKNIRWMYATPEGTVYFIDLTDLYRIENGKLKTIAVKPEERTSIFESFDLDHNVYGIWLDPQQNIYLAILSGQVVKKISQNGDVKDAVYSSGDWRPNSGVFDQNGNMWLMESNMTNEVRVRKITKETLNHNPALTNAVNKTSPFVLLIIMLMILMAAVIFIIRRRRQQLSFTK